MAYTKVKSKNINQKLSYSHSPSRLLYTLTGFTLLTTLISGLSLSSTKVSGTSTTANAAVTVSSACTMTGTLNTPHTATVNPGVYQDSIGKTTFSVICNDPNGFAIYAIGYTGEEYSGTNHTKLVGPNSNTITTGIATSGSTSNWAMKLESNDPEFYNMTIMNGYDSYSTIPDTYTKVAQITSSTASATPATMSSTYAAFIASDQTAGTYNGKVKYTMVHPYDAETPAIPLSPTECPANSICYAPNSGDIVGSMDSISSTKIASSATAGVQTNITSNSEADLIAPNYSRAGYGFAGWSTDFETNSSSVVYGPNETITTSDLSTNGMILYPVWIASTGNLQNWTGCSSLTQANYDSETGILSANLSSITALTDLRDNNVYAVARLADNNCWMAENLRLDANNSSDESLAQGFGDATADNHGKFVGLADSENANFTNVNTANSIYYIGAQSGTASIYIGSAATNDSSMRIPRYNNNNTNRNLTASYNDIDRTTYYQWYSYGNYYNFPAALANTEYFYSSANITDTSICPSGWKLITSTATNGFSKLDIQMGGTGANNSTNAVTGLDMSRLWRQFPNNYVKSGIFNLNVAESRGDSGYYWSNTTGSTYAQAYRLTVSGSKVNPGRNNGNRSYGITVRCQLIP